MRGGNTRYRRKNIAESAAMTAAACSFATAARSGSSSNQTPFFDGKTLDGWIQVQNSATSVSGSDISDLAALTKKLSSKSDAVFAFLSDQMEDTVKADLAGYAPSTGDAKAMKSTLAKSLSKIMVSVPLYEKHAFRKFNCDPKRRTGSNRTRMTGRSLGSTACSWKRPSRAS
jgi:hypothetical protein